MASLRDLLEQQGADLADLQEREARRISRSVEDARRELRERLAGEWRAASAHQLRIAQLQVEGFARSLTDRLGEGIAGAEPVLQDRAYANLRRIVERQERTFRDHGARIDVETLRRLEEQRGLALHRYSVGRYAAQVVEAAQRELVQGYLQGLSAAQIADHVAGVDGAIARHGGRGALIVRMELTRIYDAGHQVALEETAALDDPGSPDPLLKQAIEYLDARNHPFSRRLHRIAVYPRQAWEIPVTAETRRGLVWPVAGNVARGTSYPAHYHDRGRQVPWRPSWGNGVWQRPEVRPTDRPVIEAARKGRATPEAMSRGLVDHLGRVTAPAAALPPPSRPKRETLAQRIRAYEDEIRAKPEEHLAVFFRGKTLRTGPDFTRSLGLDPRGLCAIPPPMAQAIHATRTAVLSHNHPSSGPLSPQDIVLAVNMNLREIRACNATGRAFRARRPRAGWPPIAQAATDLTRADLSARLRSLSGGTKSRTDALDAWAEELDAVLRRWGSALDRV